jgi:hypothetical protein
VTWLNADEFCSLRPPARRIVRRDCSSPYHEVPPSARKRPGTCARRGRGIQISRAGTAISNRRRAPLCGSELWRRVSRTSSSRVFGRQSDQDSWQVAEGRRQSIRGCGRKTCRLPRNPRTAGNSYGRPDFQSLKEIRCIRHLEEHAAARLQSLHRGRKHLPRRVVEVFQGVVAAYHIDRRRVELVEGDRTPRGRPG